MLQRSALSSEGHCLKASQLWVSNWPPAVCSKSPQLDLDQRLNWLSSENGAPHRGGGGVLVIRKLLSCFVSSWARLLPTAVSHFETSIRSVSSLLFLCFVSVCWTSCLCTLCLCTLCLCTLMCLEQMDTSALLLCFKPSLYDFHIGQLDCAAAVLKETWC